LLCSSEHDQELDSLLVGPIPPGINKFVFEADPPSLANIPSSEIMGVTVILLTCSYDNREFVRVGYYVNNEYADEALAENPPAKPVIEKIRRNILAEKPRVTRFAIKWYVFPTRLQYRSLICTCRDSDATAPAEFPPDQPEADTAPDDEAAYGAEEAELEVPVEPEVEGAAVEAEGAEGAEGGDAEMGGVEPEVKDDASDAGSEDLEAESSGSDEEDEEEAEEEGEGEQDEEMEMDEPAAVAGQDHQAQRADVMVH
jgi:histone chaperone ASF1